MNRGGFCTASPVGGGFCAISPTEEEKIKFCSNCGLNEGMSRLELVQKHMEIVNKGSYVSNITTSTNTIVNTNSLI